MTFTDPIVAGSELVIDRINSTDYAPGVAGWMIGRDGSAEFNAATLRGSLTVGNPPSYPYQIFGGAIPAELEFDADGFTMLGVISRVVINANQELVTCFSDISGGGTPIAIVWEAAIDRAATNPVLWISRTRVNHNASEPTLRRVYGDSALGAVPSSLKLVHQFQAVYVGDDTVVAGSHSPAEAPFYFDGISAARGMRMRADSTANSGAIGAEAVLLTATRAFFKFWDGRAYEARWRQRLVASVANTSTVRVRRTNLVGQLLGDWQSPVGVVAQDFQGRVIFRRAAGAGDLAASDIALTLQASAGTTTAQGSATSVRDLEIIDIGDAAEYPNAIAIV